MSTLESQTKSFQSGAISKASFIEGMYVQHENLFAYSKHLLGVNLEEIRIRENSVEILFSDPKVWMACPEGDTRTAPIEALNFCDYERSEVQMVKRILDFSGEAKPRFVDIGANAGFFTLAVSYYFPEARIDSFEPLPHTFELLNRNLALNGINNVVTHNAGLSDEVGKMTFYTYAGQSGASSLSHNLEGEDAIEVSCEVSRLDDFGLAADFVKCDVEGAELFVFRGGLEFLDREKPVVLTELLRKWCDKFNYHPNEVIQLFRELEYSCFEIASDRLEPLEEITSATESTNFVFLHATKHAELVAELSDSK